MPTKKYCSSCGHPNSPINGVLKFCSNCGEPMSAAFTKHKPKFVEPEYEEDDEEPFELSFEPAFEILGGSAQGEKLGDVAQQRKTGLTPRQTKGKRISKKKVWQEFMEESTRNAPIQIGNDGE